MDYRKFIEDGQAVMGCEFGSTRIKAVLVDQDYNVIAQGDHVWENRYEGGYWTYTLEDIWGGLQDCIKNLREDVRKKYGTELETMKAMGFSAMMHGYMAFDKDGKLLVPFRTWRNQTTGEAAAELSELFRFNIPQRWTIAHLRQAILSKEPHVPEIDFVDTLAGYVHYKMTGEKVVGLGEGSGIIPLDSETMDYDQKMVDLFDELSEKSGFHKKVRDLLPKVLNCGDNAGYLTEEGAKLLDPTGHIKPGIPVCPPEGDAGTGMAATNSVLKRTGNVSAGTSVFSMIVLEKPLSDYYEEIDMVTTPDGSPVAMVHCSNCTSDLNAWVKLFKENLELMGVKVDMNELYGKLYNEALKGDPDCGGVLAYNYVSGEVITGLDEGRPMVVRTPEADFSLANFMRANLYSAFATLKIGNDILMKKEHVEVDTLFGHGGIFKTKGVAQQFLADALNAPVAVMTTAGEGGPWGMALIASYMVNRDSGESFPHFLSEKVFHGEKGDTLYPDPVGVQGFDRFLEKYQAGLAAEKAAVGNL